MQADAIMFDKDGTLLDFDAFWVTISVKAMEDILRELGRTDIPVDAFLTAFGVHDGVTDMEGVLCKGTYVQMGQIVHTILSQYGVTISCQETVRRVNEAYTRHADAGEVLPTCPDLAAVLTQLKKQGKKLAVVTTDNEGITRKCLEKLGIAELFDKIYTDDGKTPQKPDPYCAEAFAQVAGVPKDRMVMVGDTMTDMHFARNAGIAVIGVAKSEKNRSILAPYAYRVIPDISALPDVLN